MMTREQAIEKVKKLLSLATSNNPHEAALAARRAQEILIRYELTASMLDVDDESAVTSTAVDGVGLDTCDGPRVSTWRSYLSATVANANGCRTFVRLEWHYPSVTQTATIHIVGRPQDADKVRYLYVWVAREINRLLKKYGHRKGKTWRNNFRIGVIDAVKKKLNNTQRRVVEKMRQKHQDNPLALIKLDHAVARLDQRLSDADAYIAEHLDLTEKKPPKSASDPLARALGRHLGKQIDLSLPANALPTATA